MCMQVCRAATRRTTYRPLYQVVREYLGCHKDIWNNDSDLATIASSCMKGKARDWFDSRAQHLESIKVADKFKIFTEAMLLRSSKPGAVLGHLEKINRRV